MHVPVDDRDALEPEARLRPACGHRDRVEEAEAHRPVVLGMVARRACQREAAAAHRLDRGAGGEQRRFQRRLAANRVRVDQSPRRAHALQQLGRVTAENVGLLGRLALDEREPRLEHVESRLRLGMRARRMQPSEGFVAYELDALEDTAVEMTS